MREIGFVDTLGYDDEARPMCIMYSSVRGGCRKAREKIFVYMNKFVVLHTMR
jgi:hypothetical protein